MSIYATNYIIDEETGEEFEQKPVAKSAPAVAAPVDNIPEPTVRAAAPKVEPVAQPAPPKLDVGDVSLDDLVADWES